MNEITKLTRDLRNNQTFAEKLVWEEVRNSKLGVKFRRQHPIIYTQNGESFFFITDFACLKKHIIIEIDGKIHEQQQIRDNAREYIINKLGFKILRFTNEMVINNIEEVKNMIIQEVNRFD